MDETPEHQWVIHLYQQGYNGQEVAKFSGMSRERVITILKRHGVTIRNSGNRKL